MSAGDRRRWTPWRWGTVAACILALCVLSWWAYWRAPRETARTKQTADVSPRPRGVVAGAKRAASATDLPDLPDGWEKVLETIQRAGDRIAELVAQLSPARNLPLDFELLGEIRRILEGLASELRSVPNGIAAAAIQAYLDSGRDIGTGLGFKVGEGGLLADAPTMRTFLLDLFADIDAPASVDYAMRLLDGSGSSSEWALALRNIAWQDGDGTHRDLLRERLSQLLDRQDWLAEPDRGFLEAFDLAVHLGDPGALREMGSVLGLRDDQGKLANNGTTHAAFLAMDRITASNPGQTVDLIRKDREFLNWAPRHRGALMSRADVRDPNQAAAISDYLLRPDLSAEERYAFLRLFPNPNGILADSLISSPATPLEFSSGVERDRAALQLVRGWLADPRFHGARAELVASEARLARFVEAGAAPGSGK